MRFINLTHEDFLAIEAANKIFVEEGFNLKLYRYMISEEDAFYSVSILDKNTDPENRSVLGNPGQIPAYNVRLGKPGFRVLGQGYVQ